MSQRAVIETKLQPLRTPTLLQLINISTPTSKHLLMAKRARKTDIEQPTCLRRQIDCHIIDPPLQHQHPIRSGCVGLHLILTRKSKREIPLWIMTVLVGLNKQLWCNPTSPTTYTHTLVYCACTQKTVGSSTAHNIALSCRLNCQWKTSLKASVWKITVSMEPLNIVNTNIHVAYFFLSFSHGCHPLPSLFVSCSH